MDYNEYNFFEPIVEKKKGTNIARLAFVAIVVLAFGYLLIGTAINIMQYYAISEEVEVLNAQVFLQSQHAEELTETEERITYLENRFDYLFRADLLARNSRVITQEIMEALPNVAPDFLILDAISIRGMSMIMTGVAPTLEVLAQFEHNLRNSYNFYSPLIRSANRERDSVTYVFSGVFDGERVYNEIVADAYRFTTEVRIVGNFNLFDVIFDTSRNIVLEALDDDDLWDYVVMAMNMTESRSGDSTGTSILDTITRLF